MLTSKGHLTYCTNIHAGEDWTAHFAALKLHFPAIKASVSPAAPMGIGLRLSHQASLELRDADKLAAFHSWLRETGAYVFTMNGFPYGDFHDTVVKDQVHAPDWTTRERLQYTVRLADILAELLPDDLDGGISTSPLSYRYWFDTDEAKELAMRAATGHILETIKHLQEIYLRSGKRIHLDIEPEPDGLLETGDEFLTWYRDCLLPMGADYFAKEGVSASESAAVIRRHLCLCYDVCHFALGYENHAKMIRKLREMDISIGKIQISAALKALVPEGDEPRNHVAAAFADYNEPTYLHQVIARNDEGAVTRYRDLPEALSGLAKSDAREWRAHFHVPIFHDDFGLLQSTQADIIELLGLRNELELSSHLEVETYTWGVLPANLKLDISESISRELNWVLPLLNHTF